MRAMVRLKNKLTKKYNFRFQSASGGSISRTNGFYFAVKINNISVTLNF